jgi:hypothetical protein
MTVPAARARRGGEEEVLEVTRLDYTLAAQVIMSRNFFFAKGALVCHVL